MSRWTNAFSSHPFQTPWKEIINLIHSLSVADESLSADVEELARLKKIIVYLNELLATLDPEMVSLSSLNIFHEQAIQCLDQINAYKSNKDIGHLQNANAYLDSMLNYIRPYVVSNQEAAQAAAAAFKIYADTVNQQIDLLNQNSKEALNQTKRNREKSEKLVNEVEDSKNKIISLETRLLLGSEAEISLESKLNSLLNESQEKYSRIDEYHKKLTSGSEQEPSLISQITQTKETAGKNAEKIEQSLTSSNKLFGDLSNFYATIFGHKRNDGTVQGGLKRELEVRVKQLDDFRDEQKNTYATLLKEIETLLPGATSAGLSTAYRDLKDSFNNPIRHYSKLFYCSLAAIVVAGLILVIHKIGLFYIEFVDITNPITLANNILYKLPILGALLWLAIFASKRRSEDRRLQQEYAHKEALAKSYQGFKHQVDALNEKDEELAKKLLDTAIQAISFNASQTLDGKHGDKFPVQEIAEKIIDAVPAIKDLGHR